MDLHKQKRQRFPLFFTGVYILILSFLLVGCTDAKESDESTKISVYYDLEGFIEEQITLLTRQKPLVTKTVEKDDENETRNDPAIDWNKELELFKQADINKAALKSSYTITRSDSLHYEYKLKEGEFALVQYLNIIIDPNSGKPSQIKAQLLNENKLFNSEKWVSLHCVANNGIWRISYYEIKGYQKLSVFSESSYYIKGILR
jgi:hypothetical protein